MPAVFETSSRDLLVQLPRAFWFGGAFLITSSVAGMTYTQIKYQQTSPHNFDLVSVIEKEVP